MKRPRVLVPLLCVAALTLSACATGWPGPGNTGTQAASGVPIELEMPSAPVDLETYYDQELEWSDCYGSFQCAEASVPLDYSDPSGEAITIALLKRPAKNGNPIGSLFVNPGGPGGSGIDMAKQAGYYLSSDLLANFDIVGFDPRGVGESTPVECLTDTQLQKVLDANYLGGDAQALAAADLQTVISGCEDESGDLLPYVNTQSVARDLDILRDAVGDPKLYYLGMSYGTFIGEQYAEFFPDNVGRVVLDGVMNPTLGMAGLVYAQDEGFETAIRRYMEDCLASTSCPISGTIDEALATLSALFSAAETTPYLTDDPDRPLTQSMLFQGMILPLYGRENWYLLTQALTELVNDGTGTQFAALNDLATGREADGTYSDNSSEANWAVNCVDYPAEDEQVWDDMATRLSRTGTVFGDFMVSGGDMCAQWPGNPSEVPGPFTAEGSDPIVLIGTTYDPATPYRWATEMNEMLDNSVLLTYDGDGHTAYGQGIECIREPVDRYLLSGTVPEDGLTCAASN